MAYEEEGIEQVGPEELESIAKNKEKDIHIIDVRQPEEYAAGHIPGVPLVPMETVPDEMKNWNKDDEYIFICRSGRRSQMVAHFLKENGFQKVKNFAGGMLGWNGELEYGEEK